VFSNSIIEGVFRVLKMYYFRKLEVSSENIKDQLARFVREYNNEKPHNQHKIHTPNEIHKKPELKNIKLVLERSSKKRIEYNRNYCCLTNIDN